jgi:hypothetical protein
MWSRKLIDLTGVRFGRLHVIGLAHEKRYNKPAWLCRCDCGRVKLVPGDPLRMGKTRSCGWLHKELVAEQRRWRLPRDGGKRNATGDLRVCPTPPTPLCYWVPEHGLRSAPRCH